MSQVLNANKKLISIVVNGKYFEVTEEATISYDYLCKLANVDKNKKPNVIYTTANSQGSVLPNCFAPLSDFTVYNVTFC